MFANVEIVILFPGRMTKIEGVRRDDLLIARQQMNFRIYHPDEIIKGNFAFKDANAADMHRAFLFLEVKKARIH